MAVGITTIDGKDLDERYVKQDANGKAPNAANADYANRAGTADSATRATNADAAAALSQTLAESRLPYIGAKQYTLGDVPNNSWNAYISRDAYGRLSNVTFSSYCDCQAD